MTIFNGFDPKAAARYNVWEVGEGTLLAPHFALGEFACKDGNPVVLVHPALVVLLERIRERFNAPVHINSGYRTPTYNKKIGGAVGSIHLLGMAADIVVKGTSPDVVAAYADGVLHAGGVGRYDTFTHVDVFGANRRWDERKR